MRVPANEGQRWFELNPGDGVYLPQGVAHQSYTISDQPVEVIIGGAGSDPS